MTIPWPGPGIGGDVPALPTATASAKSKCQLDQAGALPWNIFSGPEYRVITDFCSSVELQPASSLTWIVDSRGSKKSLLKKVKAKRDSTLDLNSSSSLSIDKRTPPTDPDTYKDYHISLRWEPSGLFSCPVSCAEAYRAIADSPCGHTGGDQNAMALSGSFNMGCGTYSSSILVPGGGSVTDNPRRVPGPTVLQGVAVAETRRRI